MTKVFIDGSQGTTGLRIFDRLNVRDDIEIIKLPEEMRKNLSARIDAINSSDITFLCLPDDASKEVVSYANENVKILDTSTAHRTNEQWIYGFPEVFSDGFDKVKNSNRVAVPGCHASGFIALVKPLIDNGMLPVNALLTCNSVTGYSGGGKKMIGEYESDERDYLLLAPRQYGLAQQHKHLNEMKLVSGLDNYPIFSPIVSDFYSGMCVTVPLFKSQLNGAQLNDIKAIYKTSYTGPIVNYVEEINEGGFISANGIMGKDSMQITVQGNEDRILLIARYDNLGKGASGAALECMNIIMGVDITTGLDI